LAHARVAAPEEVLIDELLEATLDTATLLARGTVPEAERERHVAYLQALYRAGQAWLAQPPRPHAGDEAPH